MLRLVSPIGANERVHFFNEVVKIIIFGKRVEVVREDADVAKLIMPGEVFDFDDGLHVCFK